MYTVRRTKMTHGTKLSFLLPQIPVHVLLYDEVLKIYMCIRVYI